MYSIPPEYLTQPEKRPSFWISAVDDVEQFLQTRIKKGTVSCVGTSAGGRPIHAVSYGTPRQGKGTTTFSGSRGFFDVSRYLGPNADLKVYLGLSAVHGGEFEGIVGSVNLLSVLETGADLAGNAWPEIERAAEALDRIVVVPLSSPDGRARVPIDQHTYRENDYGVFQYFNTGAWTNGEQIGWPTCKEYIPLDFTKTSYPGGYPNDNGVNIMHDDFLGSPQPETRALFELTARERPDLIIDMHTGAPLNDYRPCMLRPFIEPALTPSWEALYRRVHTRLTTEGLQETDDSTVEADPAARTGGLTPNLTTALNLNCGALCSVIESPCPGYAAKGRSGGRAYFPEDDILRSQLIFHQEHMGYLAETGGRVIWSK